MAVSFEGIAKVFSGPIARASVKTAIVHFARLGVQLVLLVLLARYLGPHHYGEFAGIAALAVVVGTLSSFGLGFVVLAESAKSPDAGMQALAQAVPATLLSAVMLGSLYLWLAVAVLGSQVGLLPLLLIGASEVLLVPLLTLLGYRLHGLGFVASSQALMLWPLTLRLGGLGLCVAFVPARGVQAYAWVHALGALLALLLGMWQVRRRARLPPRLCWPDAALLRYGTRYAVMNFAASTPGELDKSLALRLLGSSGAGLYAPAARGMSLVTLPVAAMLQAALPRLIRELSYATSAARRLLRAVVALSAAYGLLVGALLHFLAPAALEGLLGPAYAGVGAVLAKVAFIAPFISLRIATGATLYALGRPLQRSAIEGSAVAIMIGLALMLAPRWGLDGLVWAVMLSEATMAAVGLAALWGHLQPRRPVASADDSARA